MDLNELVEGYRRDRVAAINAAPGDRTRLEQEYGQVWDTSQVSEDFIIESFAAPYAVCRRKADGVRGSLEFQHMPRLYFNFVEEKR